MNENQVVAFLDLLAFSNHVRENTKDALMTFNNYQAILGVKKIDEQIFSSSIKNNPIIEKLAKQNLVSTFNYFLPFSDSIFITSNNPNLFLKQLGSFILNCFTFTSYHYYNPDDPSNPTIVKFNTKKETIIENFYPTLFRGGITLGEVIPIELQGIVNNKLTNVTNLAGKGVVRAVELEQKIKGPRILFEKDLFDILDQETKSYTIETDVKGCYELLWTGFHYTMINGDSEINKFDELFIPAMNLWKANNHLRFSEHYFKFLELVVFGTIKIFDAFGHKEKAFRHIENFIISQGLEDKLESLLKSSK